MTPVARGAGWLLGLGCGLLAGCAVHRPDLPLEVPPAWTAAPAAEADSDADVPFGWWREFGSPDLIALVEEALGANQDLRRASARVEAATAQAGIAGAAARPQVELGFDGLRRQQNFVGLPIPGSEGRVLTTRYNNFGASLNLSWEIDLWGRVRAGRRAATRDLEAAMDDERAARESIAAQTAKAWFGVLEADRQLMLARDTVASFTATERQVAARYERGLRTALDLRLARANAAGARALVLRREQERRDATRRLQILLGRVPTGEMDTASELPVMPGAVPPGLPSELLGRRPDLRAADRRLDAAVARVDEARAALFPRIGLTASGGRSSGELEDLLSSSFNVWSLAGNFAQPVLQGGRLRQGVRLAEARSREALSSYAGVVQRALGEVEAALDGERLLAGREEALASAARESSSAARLAGERYQSGVETFVTLLEAQRRALDAESSWLQMRRLRLDNRVDLHLALGGGFAVDGLEENQ